MDFLNKNRLKTRIVYCMAILILFLLFASNSYIIHHFNHTCSGKECPICAEIKLAEAAIVQLSSAISFLVIFTFLYCNVKIILLDSQIHSFITPIQMKVRLNN